MALTLTIARYWSGEPAPPDEHALVHCARAAGSLVLEVLAPAHGDPPPSAPIGSCDRLWEHEVVELFLLGAGERYLEIELGPHGHYLVLTLAGHRNVVSAGSSIDYHTELAPEAPGAARRWRGWARIPLALLPASVSHANAYAIHGTGAQRRYLACHPVPGERPDFHRLACFGSVQL